MRIYERNDVSKLPSEAGMFGAAFIEADLREADQAVMSGDVVRMLRAYEKLKGIEG